MKVGETMCDNDLQQVFSLCSYLLSYPDKGFIESLEEVKSEIDSLSIPELKHELCQFFQKTNDMSLNQLIATYVYTFDFGKKTNLYVTYMSNGELRERGMDLLFLKNYYKLHGFDVTDKELPDYLPILLEFAGLADQETMKPVFERYRTNIKEIAERLNPEDNLYGHVMKSIVLAMEATGVTKSVRRSEELCLNSFCG